MPVGEIAFYLVNFMIYNAYFSWVGIWTRQADESIRVFDLKWCTYLVHECDEMMLCLRAGMDLKFVTIRLKGNYGDRCGDWHATVLRFVAYQEQLNLFP